MLLRQREVVSDPEKQSIQAAELPLLLNLSLSELRLESPQKALKYGKKALEIDSGNTKALFRCAQVRRLPLFAWLDNKSQTFELRSSSLMLLKAAPNSASALIFYFSFYAFLLSLSGVPGAAGVRERPALPLVRSGKEAFWQWHQQPSDEGFPVRPTRFLEEQKLGCFWFHFIYFEKCFAFQTQTADDVFLYVCVCVLQVLQGQS